MYKNEKDSRVSALLALRSPLRCKARPPFCAMLWVCVWLYCLESSVEACRTHALLWLDREERVMLWLDSVDRMQAGSHPEGMTSPK